MDDCVFCKIVAGEIPAQKRYEDGDLVAFDDIKPTAPVHVLVVPKKHIKNLEEAEGRDGELLGKVQLAAGRLAKTIGVGGAYKVVLNGGKLQEVPHIHYHLIGGWPEGGEK